jgi:hypothetical protein
MKRVCLAGGVVLIVCLIAILVIPHFVPWTELNCQHQDLDIHTGRRRVTTFIAFCKVLERIEETAVSRALSREFVESAKPKWQRVNTFSPGLNYSPHYDFHGSFSQISTLAALWEAARVDESTRRKMAMHILALWEFDGSKFLARDYIEALTDLFDEQKSQPLLRSIRALEMPAELAEGDRRIRTVFYPEGSPMKRVRGYRKSSSEFVRDGVWETWHANGKRACYGKMSQGEHHGRRFEWDENGTLMYVESFNHGELVEYESKDLAERPEYEEAKRLAADVGH